MRSSVLVTCALIAAMAAAAEAGQIPAKFFGNFKLEKSENFDEYLSSKGVGWILRKMIAFASVTKVFGPGERDSTYNMENLTSKKDTKYHGWVLGTSFEADGLDGTKHRITFDYNEADDTLTEHHIRLDNEGDKGETYYYTIDADGKMVLRMQNDQVTCKRWFKKE